jgi:DNA-binding CsgD family transcriptional regulator
VLLGRATERAQIDFVLSEAAAGTARCLVLDGEPGVGKTELLSYAASAATGYCVLRTTGVESELDLGFAGLVELVRPVVDLLEGVPQGQMAALKAALGLGPPATASRLLVAAGLLSLIASAAQQAPVLVLVDDFQWVDAPSAQALLFAVRRLRADRVAVLIAYRSGEQVPVQTGGLSQMAITGLDHETASEFLSDRAPGLSALVVDELYSSTGGNPLAMLEIVSRLSPGQRTGLEALPTPLPGVGGIEVAFYHRVSHLSQAARHALVLVSASGDADLALLGPALVECGYTVSDLGPAVDAGLLRLEGGRAAWRHPLVRSAVYHRSPVSERRAAHRAIAACLSEDSAAWAWHQAAAAEGPDERVARALDRVAAEASQRAGYAAAAGACEQAARLSEGRPEAARRRFSAGDAAWLAGDLPRAERLLADAWADADTDHLRGQILALRGYSEYGAGDARRCADTLLSAADLLSASDPRRAAEGLIQAAAARWWASDSEGLTTVADKVRALAVLDPGLAPTADYVEGMARTYRGEPEQGTAMLERAAAAMAVDSHNWPHILQEQAALGWLGRTTEGRAIGERRARELRSIGALGMLPVVLTITASEDLDDDRWPEAEAEATEAIEMCAELGRPAHTAEDYAILATVAAFRGDEEACRFNIKMASEAANRHGREWARLIALRAGGLLALGQGDLDAAAGAFTEVADVPWARGLRGPTVISIPDLVEVLVRTGHLKAAVLRTEQLARRTRGMTDVRAPALVLRCRALAASGAAAAELFQAAMKAHEDDPDAFVTARTHLLYGEWLRRRGERRAARAELAEALATFDNYGALPWSERARGELRATGMTLRSRPHTDSSLTPAELRVALLAADGLSTKEICAQLYLSINTVEFHLRRVYRKLGVRGRTELARRIPGRYEGQLSESDGGAGKPGQKLRMGRGHGHSRSELDDGRAHDDPSVRSPVTSHPPGVGGTS